jgi:hypothetical protein
VALKVLEVKLGSWIIAGKNLVIVHHNSANLETLIVRGSFVVVDNKWEEVLLASL